MPPRKVVKVERKRFRLKFEKQHWQLVAWLRRSKQILGNYPNFGQDRLHPHSFQFTIRRYTDSPRLTQQHRSGWSGESWIPGKPNWVFIWSTIYLYTTGCSWNQTPTQWNQIGRNITALPPVLSPSTILQPRTSHCACLSARKFGLKNVILIVLFL